jgi:hypothetical protein
MGKINPTVSCYRAKMLMVDPDAMVIQSPLVNFPGKGLNRLPMVDPQVFTAESSTASIRVNKK